MLVRKIGGFCKRAIVSFFRIFPVNKRKIVVSSYYGNGYGDNPKYIVEELLKADRYKIIWLLKSPDKKESLPKEVIPCKIGSLRAAFHYVTAGVWIDNCRKGFYFKRKGQLYIQTWHGFALKRIERDVVDSLGDGYADFALRDSREIDLIVSCSRFMTEIYKRSFWYGGEVAELGAPRNDVIINQDTSASSKVRKYFNLSDDKKILLYAPTFRKDLSLEPYSVDFERTMAACEAKLGGSFVSLIRLHPNIAKKATMIEYDERRINATAYPDMQELLAAADVVISDYSSLMFDFALSNKPCFQFATDIDAYKGDRNFYFDLSALPFSVSTDNSELEQNIASFDRADYEKKLREFFDGVGMIRTGTASRSIAELIKAKTDG